MIKGVPQICALGPPESLFGAGSDPTSAAHCAFSQLRERR